MSFFNGLFNSSQGNGFTAQGVTQDQANQATNTANNALSQQQAFVNATQGGANQALAGQQQLETQLQNQAQGNGPNPAAAQLAQTTGQNVANQAALMASQRGVGSNPGLLARQAAMQGAQTQQQAAGQAASLRAQQQLNAQQQLAAQQGQMVGQNSNAIAGLNQEAQGLQSNVLNSLSNQNNANASIAAKNAGAQNDFASGLIQSGSQILANIPFAQGGVVGNFFGNLSNLKGVAVNQNSNNQTDAENQAGQAVGSAFTNGLKGLGSAIGNLFGPSYAATPSATSGQDMMQAMSGGATGALMAGGGKVSSDQPSPQPSNSPNQSEDTQSPERKETAQKITKGFNAMGMSMASGGKVPALVSPGERYLPPKEVKKVVEGKKSPMKAGEKIPGKAKVTGAKNSYANDTVKKNLDEGGIVLPRSVTQAKHPHWEAKKFVESIMREKGKLK